MSTITIIILGIIILLGAFFVFYRKILGLISTGVIVGFIVSVVLALSVLFLPSIYHNMADNSLQRWGAYGIFSGLDEKITPILSGSEDLVNKVGTIFGGESEKTISNQYFVENMYSGLVVAVASIYRLLAMILAVVGMVVFIYLRYTMAGYSINHKLEKELKTLRDRIEELEQAQVKVIT